MNKEALLWDSLDDKRVHCHLCAHECRIPESKFGICGVRQNVDGILYTLVYGQVIAAHVDPIEKKPLYHFLPGSLSYSIATVGCNFRCGFCQNWQISQASRRDGAGASGATLMPEEIVEEARRNHCLSISYTYTEPTIFFEYAYDTAILAKKAGLANVFVTNGYMTRQALEMIKPYLDAANVDLKSFSEAYYKKNCMARLQPVLDTITSLKQLGIWFEVTTLIVPDENDSDEELSQIAGFLSGVDKDIPWHVSRFHPDYRFLDHRATPIETLKRAREIGREKGLRYIYLGNVPEGANTYCYRCQALAVERRYMGMERCNLKNGHCPACDSEIKGIWS
ncbi:MAG: AmmeMemoRadiSam system radical SAM enzyme [Syntrophobacterales bacterium CG_4_8_14_3_um_filter_49_14]|nr:MAG: AmmeMemoRadiSam system radical SAM enzyme [Syntrophobacterales bacterium CG23_combo_of_CG06-09_8_20_14_all_48_27]PJA50435.1 MAG: AmmeMemoRadiSam system radical SAM enzyme [Syntrophobacterales bacterium CG_4_9_14_3_um_filter_49_8]PJC75321.1 MAG: AmmeMemoRadiSam system radical SAM enzyme [Syntrophobacterales bacterium CG_4_8_14_3_um_filter_49_14]